LFARLTSRFVDVEITLNSGTAARKLLFTGDIGRVRDSEVAPGKVLHSGPTEGEDCESVGDGEHVRQSFAPSQ